MTIPCKSVAHFLGMTALELIPIAHAQQSHAFTLKRRGGVESQVVLVPINGLESWKVIMDKKLVFTGPLL